MFSYGQQSKRLSRRQLHRHVCGIPYRILYTQNRLIHVFPDERHRIELSFTQNFWMNITFMVVLVALFSRWVMYLYASAAVS
jgi:hypothetical protein